MRESLTAITSNALRWQLATLDVEAKLVRVRVVLKVFSASRAAPGRADNGQATAPRIGPATVP